MYSDGAWKVDKIKYNAPGALVWYRDTGYGSTNHVESNETALPSAGAKGGLLIVDSHFDPLRGTGEAAEIDPTATDNMPSRAQSSNAAFGLTKTYPFTECITGAELTDEYCTDVKAQKPVSIFTDNQGGCRASRLRNGEDLYYRYCNGSVVVPSVGNSPYTTRVVDENGTPLTEFYGVQVMPGMTLGTGNPADAGVGYGTIVEVKKAGKDNTSAVLKITPPSRGLIRLHRPHEASAPSGVGSRARSGRCRRRAPARTGVAAVLPVPDRRETRRLSARR